MIQDVAENKNMNVDVVTEVLKTSMRIMGPSYMKADSEMEVDAILEITLL